jgi:prepilin-type N-terminal cleavage/methylation domain-containing protein
MVIDMRIISKIRTKTAFTLVECIVAMAVFAIMSLLVATLLAAAIRVHRHNVQETRNIREQKRDLAQGSVVSKAVSEQYTFDFGAFGVQYDFDEYASGNSGSMELTRFDSGIPAENPNSPARMEITFGDLKFYDSVTNTETNEDVVLAAPSVSDLGLSSTTGSWIALKPGEKSRAYNMWDGAATHFPAVNYCNWGKDASGNPLPQPVANAAGLYANILKISVERVKKDYNTSTETTIGPGVIPNRGQDEVITLNIRQKGHWRYLPQKPNPIYLYGIIGADLADPAKAGEIEFIKNSLTVAEYPPIAKGTPTADEEKFDTIKLTRRDPDPSNPSIPNYAPNFHVYTIALITDKPILDMTEFLEVNNLTPPGP